VLHSAGWLEGGLASCYEKFMMDIDQLGMTQKFSEGVDLSENGQAMDAIRRSARAATISAATTPRRISRLPSTVPTLPTTIPTNNGWPRARRQRRSAPTNSPAAGLKPMRRRISIRPSTKP